MHIHKFEPRNVQYLKSTVWDCYEAVSYKTAYKSIIQ